MKTIIDTFIENFNSNHFEKLNEIIDQDCLFINFDMKATINKEKIIHILSHFKSTYHIKTINLINTVMDSKDSMLVAYHILFEDSDLRFGSAVIRVKNNKISYIKNFIVN